MADFQKHMGDFEAHDTRLLAASVDSHEDAVQTASSLKLTCAVAFGLKVEDVSHLTGAFYKEEIGFLHASGFLLNRNGTVVVAVYSTGAIDPLTAADALELIVYLEEQKAENS